jgi:hypothetical protein
MAEPKRRKSNRLSRTERDWQTDKQGVAHKPVHQEGRRHGRFDGIREFQHDEVHREKHRRAI